MTSSRARRVGFCLAGMAFLLLGGGTENGSEVTVGLVMGLDRNEIRGGLPALKAMAEP